MARRPVPVPIVEALARRTDEPQRHLLTDGHREIAVEALALIPLADHPYPRAPRLTAQLAILETVLGNVPPADVLNGWDVLAIAQRRSLC